MPTLKLNHLERFAAFNLAFLWGKEKNAGGGHGRRIERIQLRLDIEAAEEAERANREKPESERVQWRVDEARSEYVLDEADLEWYSRLASEYFGKEEGLPKYYDQASPNPRVMLHLMEEVQRTWEAHKASSKSVPAQTSPSDGKQAPANAPASI